MSTIKYKDPTTQVWTDAVVDVITEEPTLVPLSVTANGTYIPSVGTDGYSSVQVDVPNPSIGNIEITTTSQVDVKDYATAQVVDSDLVASNIKKDVDILGVVGSYEGIIPTGSVTLSQNGTYDVTEYAEAVVTAGPVVDDKKVKFVDEDWNVIAEYTRAEAAVLSALPSLPTANTYLTAVEWQLTLEEVHGMATDSEYEDKIYYIAPVYHSTIGTDATHIFLTFKDSNAPKDATICIGRTSTSTAAAYLPKFTIDWGDGSAIETYNSWGSSNYVLKTHTYAPVSYPYSCVITLRVVTDTYNVITLGAVPLGTSCNMLGRTIGMSSSAPWTATEQVERQFFSRNITKIIIGNGWNGRADCLYNIPNLKLIVCGDKDSTSAYYSIKGTGMNLTLSNTGVSADTTTNNCDCINNAYNNLLRYCPYGKTATLPPGSSYSWLQYDPALVIPYGTTKANYSFDYTSLYIYDNLTQFATSNNESFNDKTTYLPDSITSIGYINGKCNTLDCTAMTHVPTLPYDNTYYILTNRVIVPDDLYDEWINATNWSAIADYIYKESEV